MTAQVARKQHASANELLRPRPHAQFRLLPVPIARDVEWNERVARWAAA